MFKIGISWNLFHLVLLGFTGFYWVLMGNNGFYWFLLIFTGFYWVLLVFLWQVTLAVLVIPLLTTAYAEVNAEGRRLLKVS